MTRYITLDAGLHLLYGTPGKPEHARTVCAPAGTALLHEETTPDGNVHFIDPEGIQCWVQAGSVDDLVKWRRIKADDKLAEIAEALRQRDLPARRTYYGPGHHYVEWVGDSSGFILYADPQFPEHFRLDPGDGEGFINNHPKARAGWPDHLSLLIPKDCEADAIAGWAKDCAAAWVCPPGWPEFEESEPDMPDVPPEDHDFWNDWHLCAEVHLPTQPDVMLEAGHKDLLCGDPIDGYAVLYQEQTPHSDTIIELARRHNLKLIASSNEGDEVPLAEAVADHAAKLQAFTVVPLMLYVPRGWAGEIDRIVSTVGNAATNDRSKSFLMAAEDLPNATVKRRHPEETPASLTEVFGLEKK